MSHTDKGGCVLAANTGFVISLCILYGIKLLDTSVSSQHLLCHLVGCVAQTWYGKKKWHEGVNSQHLLCSQLVYTVPTLYGKKQGIQVFAANTCFVISLLT